jgi:hypothetical protein
LLAGCNFTSLSSLVRSKAYVTELPFGNPSRRLVVDMDGVTYSTQVPPGHALPPAEATWILRSPAGASIECRFNASDWGWAGMGACTDEAGDAHDMTLRRAD